MKTKISFFTALIIAGLLIGCKKDKKFLEPTTDKYASLSEFYEKNEVKLQSYKINALSGGSFTSPSGTVVTIPANCFEKEGNPLSAGEVTIEFKDLYSKSDMLLNDVSTIFFDGKPLKSGGEFFIKALQNDTALTIAAGKNIEIEQPLNGLPLDTAMQAMILIDTIDFNQGGGNQNLWFPTNTNSLFYSTSSYIFSLYQFNSPISQGSWCNSDNSSYFSAFTTTSLTVEKVDGYQLDVFLLFKDVNSMLHVYPDYLTGEFPYNFAPIGQECTVVVLGIKDDKLYSSFTPITISTNQIVTPLMSETTSEAFKAAVNTLNE